MWNFIKVLFASTKFKIAAAALVVWVASLGGLDIDPGTVEAVLAIIAGWLGVSMALQERRTAILQAAGEVLADRLTAAQAKAAPAPACLECARRGN